MQIKILKNKMIKWINRFDQHLTRNGFTSKWNINYH